MLGPHTSQEGVKLGNPLSPFLFNLLLDICLGQLCPVASPPVRSKGTCFSHLAFANNVAQSGPLLQRMPNETPSRLQSYGIAMEPNGWLIAVHPSPSGQRASLLSGSGVPPWLDNITAAPLKCMRMLVDHLHPSRPHAGPLRHQEGTPEAAEHPCLPSCQHVAAHPPRHSIGILPYPPYLGRARNSFLSGGNGRHTFRRLHWLRGYDNPQIDWLLGKCRWSKWYMPT